MLRKAIIGLTTFILLSALIFVQFSVDTPPIAAQSSVPYGFLLNSVPPNDTITIVENATFQYSVRISQVTRGAAAWQRLKAVNQFSSPPRSGTEYLLFYVTIKYLKGTSGSEIWLTDSKFSTYSNKLWMHVNLDTAVSPEPALIMQKPVVVGGTAQGWVVKQIYSVDPYPIIALGGSIMIEAYVTDAIYFAGYVRKSAGKPLTLPVGSTSLVQVYGKHQLENQIPSEIVAKAGEPPEDFTKNAIAPLIRTCSPGDDSDPTVKTWIRDLSGYTFSRNWVGVGRSTRVSVTPQCTLDQAFAIVWYLVNSSEEITVGVPKDTAWAAFALGWNGISSAGSQTKSIPTATQLSSQLTTKAPVSSSKSSATQALPTRNVAGSCPNVKATCSQLSSCDQARACLAAGNRSLDRDNDGIPCESLCKK